MTLSQKAVMAPPRTTKPTYCGGAWRGRGRVAMVHRRVVEAATDQLDEDVLEAGLRLLEGDDAGTQATQGADDATERGVVIEDEVDHDRLAFAAHPAGTVAHGGGADDAGQGGQRCGSAGEPVQLQAEDRLALNAAR